LPSERANRLAAFNLRGQEFANFPDQLWIIGLLAQQVLCNVQLLGKAVQLLASSCLA
jgi:hypothetical protein